MIVKPINESVKEHFLIIYQAAQAEGKRRFKEEIEAKISQLESYHQMETLVSEYLKLNEIEKNSDHPFYIYYHNQEDKLLNQFASRTFLLSVDESQQLHECIVVGRLKMEVYSKISLLERSIPIYTFKDFIGGKRNLWFSNLGMGTLFYEENLDRIMAWQEAAIIDIANYESTLLIRRMQAKCKAIKGPLEFLKAEHYKMVEGLLNTSPDFINIVKELSKIFIFSSYELKTWEQERLIQSFKQYISGEIDYKYFTYKDINPILTKVRKKSKSSISNEITIFYTIIKVVHWLERVIKEGTWEVEVSELDWRHSFENTIVAAKEECKIEIQKIEEYLNGDKTEKEIRKYLVGIFNSIRSKFNAFQYKYYFKYFDGEKKEEFLIRKFTSNGFFSNEHLNQLTLIKDAYIIQALAWWIVKKHWNQFGDKVYKQMELNLIFNELPKIISYLVFDRELYQKMVRCLPPEFNVEHWVYRMPIQFQTANNIEILESCFLTAQLNLEKILENADSSKKTVYLHNRLLQMRKRNLDFYSYWLTEFRDHVETTYSNSFKKMLKAEVNFLAGTKAIASPGEFDQKGERKVFSLNSIFGNEDESFIENMLKELGIAINDRISNHNISPGALWGIAKALKESIYEGSTGIRKITVAIGLKTGIDINSNLNGNSFIAKEFYKKANRYIDKNYKK